MLEPCKGAGNFLKHLPQSAAWCEIKEGRNFFAWTQKVDWIITNPPWSQMRRFLQQAMSVADHVVFLISLARGMRSWPVKSLAHYFIWLACGICLAREVPGYFTGLFHRAAFD